MPNHWESSGRPLFVRTVFVNGNRHAVLFEGDPLLNCGNSPLKKISRPNSSLSSFASDRSLTGWESPESNSDDRAVGQGNVGQRQRGKDLSSELQNCLIKLQLASAGNLERGIKSDDEKYCCHGKEPNGSRREISEQKRHKWKRDKNCRRKHCEHFQGDSRENKLIGERSGRDNSRYYYNFESGNNRKKNYCVVKISSNPPQLTLNCRCEGGHKCKGFPTGRDNMVISATIHNLFMTARKEKLPENRFLCESIDSIDLYWNSYLTRSYYNSLSERVYQWLDLSSKRKNQKQKRNCTREDDSSSNGVERIFSGKTFTGESKKTEDSDRFDDEQALVKGENTQSGTAAFVEEPNIRTDLDDGSRECFEEGTTSAGSSKSSAATTSVPVEPGSNSPLKNCTNPPKSPLKIQDLLLDYDLRGNFDISLGKRNPRKIKQTRLPPPTSQTKFRQMRDSSYSTTEEEDEVEEENDNVLLTRVNSWERRTARKKNKYETYGEQTSCHCDRNSDGFPDKLKSEILTEGFTERSQKSIGNLNITRTKSLSSQQRDEISGFPTEKTVWRLEKGTGRLQLHIFMPSLLLREASDDSMSECENVLNLC